MRQDSLNKLELESNRMLDLIGGIYEVMKQDLVLTVTRKQILDMGNIADGHIPDSKKTAETLVDILDEMKIEEYITQDDLKLIGGMCVKVRNDSQV